LGTATSAVKAEWPNWQVEDDGAMLARAQAGGDAGGGIELHAVPLPVVEGDRIAIESLAAR